MQALPPRPRARRALARLLALHTGKPVHTITRRTSAEQFLRLAFGDNNNAGA